MSDLLNQASLVMIPSGYKEDIVYSEVPTNGNGDLAFTRASNGTRVNSAGLVEVVPWNLVQYSEDFGNAYWTKSLATITSNASTAPNGTTTADRLQISNSARGVVLLIDSTTAGTTLTFSLYAKANGQNLLRLFCDQSCTYFQGATIVTLTNEWVRYSLTVTATQTGAIVFGFDNVSDSTTTCGGTNGTTDCFIWGAQLNIGSTAKPYFPTTDRLNVPRLTYQNGGGGCPSLLLEKQSTNLALYSEQFDNAAWSKSSVSITANQTTSPDGTINADKLIENSANILHEIYQAQSLTSGVTYVNSIFAKSAERTQISINFVTGGFSQGASVVADLSNGTLGTVVNYGSVTGSSATIQDFGNGWYKISLKMTPATTSTFYLDYSPALSGNRVYQGNGTDGIYIYGAQLEASSYPTSYIPTTSASATRVADACFKTGISSLINSNTGTFFYDGIVNTSDYTNTSGVFFEVIGTSTANTFVFFMDFSNGYIKLFQNPLGSVITLQSANFRNQRFKLAFAYANADFVCYVDGVQTFASPSVPLASGLANIYVNTNRSFGENAMSIVNDVQLYTTRLTNAELATLTTL